MEAESKKVDAEGVTEPQSLDGVGVTERPRFAWESPNPYSKLTQGSQFKISNNFWTNE